MPVSSTLYISWHQNLYLSKTSARLLKNLPTLCLLKLVALLRVVNSGVCNERVQVLLMKFENQSAPAISVSVQFVGTLMLLTASKFLYFFRCQPTVDFLIFYYIFNQQLRMGRAKY